MTFLAPGLIIAGKYVLETKLGAGGMGAVWGARHLQLDARVAIKFIDPARAFDDADMRFAREARACAQVQSPHIIRVHDYGVEDDMPYIVMELVTGESLADRLKRCGRLGLVEMSEILTQICKGLRHAHEAGIIHRDLKPSNIFIAQVHEDEAVKILDFGIAKGSAFADGAATRIGCLVGTPRYMSPEQIRRSPEMDHRTDLWSLGVVVFRCLTGQLPFHGPTIPDVLIAVDSAPIPVPSQIAPDLGPDVDRFFERALARDPAARFQSAREMAAAFAVIAKAASSAGASAEPRSTGPEISPPTAARPSGRGRAPRRKRRPQYPLWAVLVAILVTGGVAAVTLSRVHAPRTALAPGASGALTSKGSISVRAPAPTPSRDDAAKSGL